MVQATRILREMVEVKQRFVFIAGEPREAFLRTIGQALRPSRLSLASENQFQKPRLSQIVVSQRNDRFPNFFALLSKSERIRRIIVHCKIFPIA